MPKTTAQRVRKRTFYMHRDVLEGVGALVRAGYAPSQKAVIEQLVRRQFGRLQQKRREQRLRAALAAAMRDPRYRASQEAVEREFAPLDRETWGTDSTPLRATIRPAAVPRW